MMYPRATSSRLDAFVAARRREEGHFACAGAAPVRVVVRIQGGTGCAPPLSGVRSAVGCGFWRGRAKQVVVAAVRAPLEDGRGWRFSLFEGCSLCVSFFGRVPPPAGVASVCD
ncbi:unnamed protein product [Ectocarpus sp. 8 AP-2014]